MNEQEIFWSGKFGDEYTRRNVGRIEINVEFFRRALEKAPDVTSVIEFGAGAGENLAAIHELRGLVSDALELNSLAFDALSKLPFVRPRHVSLLDEHFGGQQWDLVFTKGVLIHIAPENLRRAYDQIATAARKYVLIAEYFSPRIEPISYRGKDGVLWKGDYANEFIGAYPWFKVVDYGFVWRRDPNPQDDLTWFLLRRS